MSFDIWIFLEWLGAILALSGSFILASHKLKPTFTWYLWLGSNICYILYFYKFNQQGLFLMNIFGFLINLFGLYQWIQHETKINNKLTSFLFSLALLSFSISAIFTVLFIISPSIKNAEYLGSALGVGAAFLVSSRHKYSFMCWFVWCISNFILLVMTILTKQYGFLFLQFGFMFINIYGAFNWVKKFKITQSIPPMPQSESIEI